MIPITLGPEPAEFDDQVRQPGLQFLRDHGIAPTQIVEGSTFRQSINGSKPDYWRRVRSQLKAAFQSCCAYSCFCLEDSLTPNGSDLSASVDHFQPVSRSPAALAYEWSNLRWAWQVIDGDFKRDRLVPLDPCHLQECPFCLDVGDFGIILPRESLSLAEHSVALETIQVLGLNRPVCVNQRRRWANDFMENAGRYSDDQMHRWQPFLWQELKRLRAIP